MKKLQVPEGLLGPRENGQALAVGPFVVIHNGEKTPGFFLEDHEDSWVVSDGGRDYDLDSTYTATSTKAFIRFHSDVHKSTFLLRPLTQADAAWITPDEPENDIEDLKELLLDGATSQYPGD